MKITLIGFMGSGKSTIAQALGNKINIKQQDLDELFEKRSGQKIPQFFEQFGETAFRAAEHKNLKIALKETDIISTGGGTPLQANNFELIKNHPTIAIFLNAQDNTIKEHLIHDEIEKRPLFKQLGMTGIIKLKHDRQATYEELADLIINIDHKSPKVIVQEIIDRLELREGVKQ